jgi:hypothetical protein
MKRRKLLVADSNPVVNIDAGRVGDRFFPATGRETENKATPLRGFIALKETGSLESKGPTDLPDDAGT